jgi:hypothetical protein
MIPALSFAQGVYIGSSPQSPDTSAGLEIDFNDKGLLIPRMTTSERNAIASPAQGLQIFNTSTECLEIYITGAWLSIKCRCTSYPNAGFTVNPTSPSFGNAATVTANFQSGTHSWSFPGTSPSTSSAVNPSVTWPAAGTYPITHVVDSGGCVSTFTDSVTVSSCPSGIDTFLYTGSMQTFTVPSCVTSVNIKVWGAQGGSSFYNTNGNFIDGGLGGYAEGDLAVTGGQTLYVAVGRKGSPNTTPSAGWNGGACAGNISTSGYGGGGGDGSDVRVGGQTFSDRVIVAGGGGGAWTNTSFPVGSGGVGGGTTGGNWAASQANGGTQTAGGVIGGGSWNFNGGFGYGGTYSSTPWPSGCGNGGGGGGGWYGGSAASGCCAGPGAGGSGYIGGVTNGSMQSGVRAGNGLIIISY